MIEKLHSLIDLGRALVRPEPQTEVYQRQDGRPVRRWDSSYYGIPSVWQNIMTGQGGSADNMSGWVPFFHPLSYDTLDALHEGTALAYRIVWMLPEKAMAKGFHIGYKGPKKREERQYGQAIRDEAKRLRLSERVTDAAGFGRLYGGAGLLITTTDGTPATPLRPGRVRKIASLVVFDARRSYPTQPQLDPLSPQTNSRYPDHAEYWIAPYGMNRVLTVHPSRVAIFGGTKTSSESRWRWYRGWDASVLQTAWDQLRKMGGNSSAISRMLNTASRKILKTALHDIISGVAGDGGLADLLTRLQMIIQTESMFNCMAIDKDTEEYQVVNQAFAGVRDISENDQAMLAASVGYPQTVLLGRSPAGMNATGKSDSDEWNSQAIQYQHHHLKEPTDKIIRLIAYSQGAQDPERWESEWPHPSTPTTDEQADTYLKNAQADAIYLQFGMDQSRLFVHRFPPSGYNPEPPSLPETDVQFLGKTADMNNREPEPGEEGT
jgi:phage-related protein (TIGR01555 family)